MMKNKSSIEPESSDTSIPLIFKDKKYHALLQFAPYAFFHGDAKGNFITVNKKAIELTGYSDNELLSMNMSDLFSPMELTTKPLRYDLLNQSVTIKTEREIVKKGGRKIFIEMNSLAMPDGTYQCFAIDISEQRLAIQSLQQSEEKFKQLFENAADAIFIADFDSGLIIDSNNTASRLIQIPREKIIGMHYTKLHPPYNEQYSKDTFKKHIGAANQELASLPTENIICCADGTEVPVEVLASKIIIKGKQCLMGTFRDISLRKQSEEKMLHVNQQLQELNSTKDKLFSIIAHDLKSPFNSIIGLSDLLIENIKEYDIKKSQTFVAQINSSAKNTLALLENLLSWAKTQTGQIEFKPEKLNLENVLRDIQSFYSLATIKNISMRFDPSIDKTIYADKNMLETILRNLLSNAIKFTKPGGLIKISTSANADAVEIIISDNGIGMNAKILERLFNIDDNCTTPGTANEKGSGLGLILCKEFVNTHGGKIWADSIEGMGSNFHFTLPG